MNWKEFTNNTAFFLVFTVGYYLFEPFCTNIEWNYRSKSYKYCNYDGSDLFWYFLVYSLIVFALFRPVAKRLLRAFTGEGKSISSKEYNHNTSKKTRKVDNNNLPPTWETSKNTNFDITKIISEEADEGSIDHSRFLKALFRVFYFIAESDGKIDPKEEDVMDKHIYKICRRSMENQSYVLYSLGSIKKEIKDEKKRLLGPEVHIIKKFIANDLSHLNEVYESIVQCITADKILDPRELDILETIDSVFNIKENEILLNTRDSVILELETDQIFIYYKWYFKILKRQGLVEKIKKYFNNQYIKWKTLEQSQYDHLIMKSIKIQKIIFNLRRDI